MKQFVRIRFRQVGRSRPCERWAVKLRIGVYRQVNREGEWGSDGVLRMIVLDPADLIEERQARIHPKYGELEVV